MLVIFFTIRTLMSVYPIQIQEGLPIFNFCDENGVTKTVIVNLVNKKLLTLNKQTASYFSNKNGFTQDQQRIAIWGL